MHLESERLHRLFGARVTTGEAQEDDGSLFSSSGNSNAFPPLPSTSLPLHPYLQRKVLASGLEVFLLPHAHPAGSLEVHLEVHAGSTAEAENERGMAHLCEHLIFMGNRRRGDVMALQGEANAFTDFHHTVYFVSWRVGDDVQRQEATRRREEAAAPDGMGTMRKLNVALEMMREVFTVLLRPRLCS